MALRFRHLLLTLLVVLTLLTAGLWLARDRLVGEVLRPWLATEAARVLDGEVTLDELSLAWGRIELRGVRYARQDLAAGFEELHIDFTLNGLLQRRLDELVMRRPDIRLTLPLSKPDQDVQSLALPDRAPFALASWSIADGRLRIDLQDDSYNVQELSADGRFGEDLHFAVSARVGAGEGVGVALAGDGSWKDGVELTVRELAWGNRSLLTKPVTIRPDSTNDLQVEVELPNFSAAEAAELLAAFGRPVPWPEEMQWQVTAPAVALRLNAARPVLRLRTGAGSVAHAGRSWPWDSAEVGLEQVADVWQINARLGLSAGALVEVSGKWRNDSFTGTLKSFAPQPAQLAAAFGVKLPDEARKGRSLVVTAGVQADQHQVGLSDGHLTLDWAGSGKIVALFRGDWRGGKVAAKVERLALTDLAGKSELVTAALDLAGDPAAGAWRGRWQLAADELHALARTAGVAVTDNLPDLRELRVAGRLEVLGERVNLPEVKLAARLEGAGLSGRLDGRLAGALDEEAGASIDLEDLSVTGVEYSNADGTVVAAGGRLNMAGQVHPAATAVAFDLHGKAALDEALVGGWYGNLQDRPLGFSLRGRWLPESSVAQLAEGRLDVDGLATIGLNGHASAQELTLDARLTVPRLSGRFLQTLQQLGGELAPVLKDITLDGAISVAAEVARWDEGWRLTMELLPENLAVGMGDAFTVSGLKGSLPFILQVGALPDVAAERTGRLTWERLKAPLVDAADGTVVLLAATNRWQLSEPVTVGAAGGRASLKALQLSWQMLEPTAEAALSIEEVELAEVSRNFGWPELGGRFGADLDGIRFSRAEIVTSGKASARAFGGQVQLSNLKVLAPLSRYPTYHADIDFGDIDLHALTRTFAFGEINGVASGHVRGLRLFDGVPSAFDARFETAESGTRNISVKAIRNLNTLSHGGLSAALSQGVYRFIDFYRYRRIGMSCSLRNDVFRLEGTARAGSSQYLIDGGWLPPRIDVIVSSPVISFKEMVRRLKRIERTDR